MKNHSMAFRFLSFGLAFCWWGGIAMLVLLPLLVMGGLSFGGDLEMDVSYAGYASSVETSGLSVFNKEGAEGIVELDNGTVVKLSFPVESEGRKWGVVGAALFLSAVVLCLFLFLVKQLREILKTVSEGDPFVESNATRVRIIGLILLFATFGQSLVEFAIYGYADAMFRTEGFDLDGRFNLDGVQLLAGLCVLVLSEVFRLGSRMREEQSLTV